MRFAGRSTAAAPSCPSFAVAAVLHEQRDGKVAVDTSKVLLNEIRVWKKTDCFESITHWISKVMVG